MNTKLFNITRYGLAAGLLVGALALGGASAASASVPRPCPGGTCGGHPGPPRPDRPHRATRTAAAGAGPQVAPPPEGGRTWNPAWIPTRPRTGEGHGHRPRPHPADHPRPR